MYATTVTMAFISQYTVDEANDIEIDQQNGDDFFIDLIQTRPWIYDKSNRKLINKSNDIQCLEGH